MGGFSQIVGQEDIVHADNASFDGTSRGGAMTTNGQLWIGSTALPHVRVGSLASSDSSVTITPGAGSIDLKIGSLPPAVPLTFTADTGSAIPALNVLRLLGGGSIATNGSGNTVTHQLTGLTNHALLFGQGTPTIGTLTLTNGQLAIGSTGANPVAANISAGTGISVTNGAGTISIAATGGFAPNATLQVSDDFIFSTNTPNMLNWGVTGAWAAFTTPTAAHPGIISNPATAVSNSIGYLSGSSGAGTFTLGGGTLTVTWVFNIVVLSAASPRYILRFGLGDVMTGTSDQSNGAYFEYSDNLNSGEWNYKTAAATVRTTSNSNITVTTGWHTAQLVVNAAATSVSFTMDSVSLGTAISTNIPTATTAFLFQAVTSVGTMAAGDVLIDLFSATYALTTPR